MAVMNEPAGELAASIQAGAVLDDAHVGHIHGAFDVIWHGDNGPRIGWQARAKTLLAILGPGLIVMVGDNDAGAFGTSTQAGQNYGTALLWTLMLLIRSFRCSAHFIGYRPPEKLVIPLVGTRPAPRRTPQPLEIIGGPGRTRTCNQTVMSGRL